MLRRSALQLASEPTIDSAVAWGRTRLGPREQSKWLLPAEVASKSFIVISFMRIEDALPLQPHAEPTRESSDEEAHDPMTPTTRERGEESKAFQLAAHRHSLAGRSDVREHARWLLPSPDDTDCAPMVIEKTFQHTDRLAQIYRMYIANCNKKQRDQDQCYGNIWQTHFN